MEVGQSEWDHAANLEKVDHVVIMMLENRSFDHMLGYLSLTGGRPEIDGLQPGFANDHLGTTYPIHHLDTTAVDVDPDHSAAAVNDDHPPADIADGQDLVLAAYDALAAGPLWDRSLLVIVYDEHGGFYDHVPPPRATDDDPEMFGRYGVRVPAIIVSPWVEPRTVSSTLFDHTSIIKSILLRFCPGALRQPRQPAKRRSIGAPQYPGLRVAHANHLGGLLTRSTPRPAPPREALLQRAAARANLAPSGQPHNGEPANRPLNDLQRSVLAAAPDLARRGHPVNAP